ncbi:MAG: hypothetical protein OXL36_19790 [Bryobacterales bacterium]|nr:hypothetical protein [Bryobacterales bacterium]MDE0296956.1 hypothetical protein [Bryobacterales bacterium]
MYDLIKDAIKGIFLVLFFLFIGILTEFAWSFWFFVLLFALWRYIDAPVASINNYLNNLTEKLRQNRLNNHPPQ